MLCFITHSAPTRTAVATRRLRPPPPQLTHPHPHFTPHHTLLPPPHPPPAQHHSSTYTIYRHHTGFSPQSRPFPDPSRLLLPLAQPQRRCYGRTRLKTKRKRKVMRSSSRIAPRVFTIHYSRKMRRHNVKAGSFLSTSVVKIVPSTSTKRYRTARREKRQPVSAVSAVEVVGEAH